jgi:hypothetical protein
VPGFWACDNKENHPGILGADQLVALAPNSAAGAIHPMLTWSELRRAELRALRWTNPALLLALYREAAKLDLSATIPPGQTFPTMIEMILDQEELDRAVTVPPN